MRVPDARGYFGPFGGRFVPETLIAALEELSKAYAAARRDRSFKRELEFYLRQYAGRPTPLSTAERFTRAAGGGTILLKREDLCHTGAHKINNSLGQALLARRLSKKRVIAETGAGQHGVATATAAALFGLSCDVYMGERDVARQALNVYKMKLLGARVIPVKAGSRTLKDATNEAIRDWVTNVDTTYYLLGSTVGPHPYPMMVRDFQSVIGREVKSQLARMGKRATHLVACIGGGSNSLGLFYPFLNTRVNMIGVEAAGKGLASGQHAAALACGQVGVLHGMKSFVLADRDGQIREAHSVSAGLDYPSVGPEHAYLKALGRVTYVTASDREAIAAFQRLTRLEGIMPALEPAHALAYVWKWARRTRKSDVIVVNLSGRGDKDLDIVRRELNA